MSFKRIGLKTRLHEGDAMKKTIGFILGFIFGLMLLTAIFGGSGYMPRGAGWLVIPIALGSLGAKILNNYNEISESIKGKWWALDKNFRLVIFISVIWVVGYYILTDRYESNGKTAFIPPLLLIAFYFGNKILVNKPNQK